MSTATNSVNAACEMQGTRLGDYLELTKPEVTSLVLISAAAGFYLGSRGPLDPLLLLHTLIGTALVSGGTAAFNQFFERKDDAKMRRTARRPLPAGRLQPAAALRFAAVLSIAGILYLALLVNLLASFLAAVAWSSYLFLYTPLKKKTVLCTAVGVFPGAVPSLIGWAAVRNGIDVGAWVLYAIVLLWQFPHFLSIAWMYREDYARGRILMLPVVDPTGAATGRQIVLSSTALLAVSVIPTMLGQAGVIYFWGALLLGLAFLQVAIRAAVTRSNMQARRLLHASVVYLPVLLALLMLDKHS